MRQTRRASKTSESAASKIFPQIQPAVKTRYLGGVAVEGQGGLPRTERIRTNVTFGCLAPPWMIDGRIDIGEEAILVGGGTRPSRARCVFAELNADDGLDALEAV